MKPIPLSAPDGQVYGYACSHCHHIGGMSSLMCPPESDGPHPQLVESSLRDAEWCCLCRDCGDVISLDNWSGLSCEPCRNWLNFVNVWPDITVAFREGITTMNDWVRWTNEPWDEDDE